ncbi:helix-turn-helix domain-containing protein [Streptomyces sp. CWNU-52B]|uniref:helix-turn-helix domain-containing protein n=1 Tax=unclassified Streptomyces TaxID=2593676 RepID=UPI0039C434CB
MVSERTDTDSGTRAGAVAAVEGVTVSFGEGWDTDDGTAPRAADKSGHGVVIAFGQSMKTLRVRAGLEREEFGKRLGYSAASVASFEQGRRIPSPQLIDRADEVLDAGGLLSVWKEQVERAQYPVFFQGMATLEKECVELLMYDTHVVNGLLQTEDYMRSLLAMRRPNLDQETIDQRVTARLARQDIFDRRPTPLLGFVMDEAVLRHRYGGNDVLREQLEQLLVVGQKRNVEIQIMPLDCEDNAGVNGPFTVVTRKDSKRFVYSEAHATSALETDPEQTVLAAARYGIIRSQALTPRESLAFIEGLSESL